MSTPAKIVQAEAYKVDDDEDDGKNNNYGSAGPSAPPLVVPFADATAYPIAPPAATATAAPLVEIIAPSNLREGYQFDAIREGKVFTVTVPSPGVKAGQTFRVPFVPKTNVGGNAVTAVPYLVDIDNDDEATPMLGGGANNNSNNDGNNNNRDEDDRKPAAAAKSSTNATTKSAPSQRHDEYYHRPMMTSHPRGFWSAGLFNCLADGCCHASFCNALFFPFVLMAQVATRMKLTMWGNPSRRRRDYKSTTCAWIFLTVLYTGARMYLRRRCPLDIVNPVTDAMSDIQDLGETLLDDDVVLKSIASANEKIQQSTDLVGKPPGPPAVGKECVEGHYDDYLQILSFVWFFLSVGTLIKVRRSVRRAYQIPQFCCLEDCFVSVFCTCCAVSQLARQTADYYRHRAYCCTSTGLDDGVMDDDDENRYVYEKNRRQKHSSSIVV